MLLNEQEQKELENAARPLMKYLSKYHPHVKVIVAVDCAELVEGVASFITQDYVGD